MHKRFSRQTKAPSQSRWLLQLITIAKKEAAWQKEMDEVQEKMRKGGSADVSQKYSKLFERRKEFINEERTGLVWLALQK